MPKIWIDHELQVLWKSLVKFVAWPSWMQFLFEIKNVTIHIYQQLQRNFSNKNTTISYSTRFVRSINWDLISLVWIIFNHGFKIIPSILNTNLWNANLMYWAKDSQVKKCTSPSLFKLLGSPKKHQVDGVQKWKSIRCCASSKPYTHENKMINEHRILKANQMIQPVNIFGMHRKVDCV